jgi:hypothetical protein
LRLWKKAVSVVTSAALLASLLVTAAAPAALAAITQTSAGNVAQGTTSAGTATFLFTENTVNALQNTGTMTVTIDDAAPGTGSVAWAGTPVVSAPASLGASATIVGADLIISITGFDNANIETISITGLRVWASSDAVPGAVVATLSDSHATDAIMGAFVAVNVTATGTLAATLPATGTDAERTVAVNVTSACGFAVTALPVPSNATFSPVADPRAITAVAAGPGTGQQTLTFAAGTTTHASGTAVSQTVPNCAPTALASPATVVRAAALSSDGVPTVFPGENNSPAADLNVNEPIAGFLAVGTTLTFAIVTPGVVFSMTPDPDVYAPGLTLSAPVLAADRRSVTVTVTTASTALAAFEEIELDGILYDVATTVPGGTFVEVSLALSGGLIVTGSPAANAVVFRGIDATAPTPTVFIGENNQPTGLVRLTERAAGFFQAGPGPNNILAVCDTAVAYDFTFAPWARVVGGDLRLREGAVASPDNIVQGIPGDPGCYIWYVWTGSTVASTIEIGNATFTSGPLINVHVNQPPGLVAMQIFSGNETTYDDTMIATVGFAVAAFRTQVAVTALSQPLILRGATSRTGGIQIAETAHGQLKLGQNICVQILPRTALGFIQARQDTFIHALTTAQLPVVTATGGLVISPVTVGDRNCEDNNFIDGPAATQATSFSFRVLQQSTAGNGRLVIDNINVITLADAPFGPVLFNVFGYGVSPTVVDFQATVSPARIGERARLSISAVSALGRDPATGYNTRSPKVQVANRWVTWKFAGGDALAGQRVNVLVARRIAGAWGGPRYLRSAWADANGIVTVMLRQPAGTVLNVRIQWPGDANHAVSTSRALGAHWR